MPESGKAILIDSGKRGVLNSGQVGVTNSNGTCTECCPPPPVSTCPAATVTLSGFTFNSGCHMGYSNWNYHKYTLNSGTMNGEWTFDGYDVDPTVETCEYGLYYYDAEADLGLSVLVERYYGSSNVQNHCDPATLQSSYNFEPEGIEIIFNIDRASGKLTYLSIELYNMGYYPLFLFNPDSSDGWLDLPHTFSGIDWIAQNILGFVGAAYMFTGGSITVSVNE